MGVQVGRAEMASWREGHWGLKQGTPASVLPFHGPPEHCLLPPPHPQKTVLCEISPWCQEGPGPLLQSSRSSQPGEEQPGAGGRQRRQSQRRGASKEQKQPVLLEQAVWGRGQEG